MSRRVTAADDYPLHQSARPLRDAGTERNLYDRFFLNGYSPDGSVFFAVALGQYPGRDIMDAAVSVVVDGTQHNLRASRLLGDDRLDLRVGPIAVRVVEPMRVVDVEVDDSGPGSAGSGMSARMRFTARAPVFEEPPFLMRAGHVTRFDYTRMTQNGSWSGSIRAGGRTIELDDRTVWGTKDRSWGVRPVGEREAGGPPQPFSFFWLWAPMNFEDGCGHFDVNEEPDGARWHETAMWAGLGDTGPVETGHAGFRLEFRPGTRHARAATIELDLPSGRRRIELAPVLTFFMNGIGYTHPSWGHGMYLGDDVRGYDSFATADVDESAPVNLHVQELCRLRREDGAEGMGVLEQLLIGPHEPTGLTGLLDPHP